MKRTYQISEGAYFVPTYFETTIVQSFDTKATIQTSGTSVEENDDQIKEVEQGSVDPHEK